MSKISTKASDRCHYICRLTLQELVLIINRYKIDQDQIVYLGPGHGNLYELVYFDKEFRQYKTEKQWYI